ncbi:MAG: N-acetylneuraminate synthase family protein [Candidatus Pacebacteria bacterium]|nr:N-acetylneuraminate synthase family protein [Candidatus Paceibacterota bacterium]MDD4830686.1 N-acetylneuraminate synthase family protein [Candidatus Paceibacterota bacterium]MDD4875433.1 N-acetylneuraminate synthase family protein [Candidatus Paceibacterota bacterium]
MQEIKIGNKLIGSGQPCFIIAEAGVNHNGNLDLAFKLVDEAKKAGADCVKFQTFYAENIESKNAVKPDYFQGRDNNLSKMEFMKSLELKPDEFSKLKDYCDKKDIIFMSSLCDPKSFEVLTNIKVSAFKIGAPDSLNVPLLRSATKTGIPILLSTGITNIQDIEFVVNDIKTHGNSEIALFQCTSQYPAPYGEINLKVIEFLKEKFDCPVGLSDHSEGIFIPVAGVAMGANMIEKHFTLSRNLPGVDQPASIEPQELKEMVYNIRKTEEAIGKKEKSIQPSEKEHLISMRKSLVAAKKIGENYLVQETDILVKRPGNGISPTEIDKLIGKRTKKPIEQDDLFSWDQFYE